MGPPDFTDSAVEKPQDSGHSLDAGPRGRRGLCRGPWDQVQAEVVPKPSIWAKPGPMITRGSPVTLWCQGSLQATAYTLYRERAPEPWVTRITPNFSKTSFHIESSSSQHAGLYECAYYTTERKLSERSDPLLLVVTGVDRAPSLSAQPSPVVASGGSVSLVCSSQDTSGTFHLLKEGGADPPRHMEPQSRSNAGSTYAQATFPVGPVNTSHGGTYRCYGSPRSYPNQWSYPSDPLRLVVTGVHREPSLSAQPGSLVLPGDSLTLQCGSEAGFDRFALTKDQGLTKWQRIITGRDQDLPPALQGSVVVQKSSQKTAYGSPGSQIHFCLWPKYLAGTRVLSICRALSAGAMTSLLPALLCLGQLWRLATGGSGWLPPSSWPPQSSDASSGWGPEEGNQLHVRERISDWVSPPGLSLDQRIHTQAALEYPHCAEKSSQKTAYGSPGSQIHFCLWPKYSAGTSPRVLSLCRALRAGAMTSLLPALLCLIQLWRLATGGGGRLHPSSWPPQSSDASAGRGPEEGNQLHVRERISDWVSPPGLSLHQRIHTQAGTLPKPTIWAEPGSVVPSGSSVTFWCQGTTKALEYCLYTDDMRTCSDRQTLLEPGDSAKFLKRSYAGKYSCAYLSPSGWSEHSDPLELVLTGFYPKPSLSALPSPVVTSGGNVTFQCGSRQGFDRFILTKEGERRLSWTLDSEKNTSGKSQALFVLGPLTLNHSGSFRCYGYYNRTSNELSDPSDPLDLHFSGSAQRRETTEVQPSSVPSSAAPAVESGGPFSSLSVGSCLPWYLYVLIGTLVAFILLLILLFLRHQRQGKGRTSDAAMKDPQPGESVDSRNRQDEDPQTVTYTVVNHPRARLRQGTGSSTSSLSGGLLDTKDRHGEKDQQMDSPATESATPKDVTYAQLNLWRLRQEASAPLSSLPKDPPEVQSVYAFLSIPSPRKDPDPTLQEEA
ncbi:leukocyte immunoglobulin-like receptor subfamily B member 1 [Molossus nigricans]